MFKNAILFRVNLAQKFYSFCKKFENDERVYIFNKGPFLHAEVFPNLIVHQRKNVQKCQREF